MNLTNICTRLDIFSLPPVAPIFPFQIWSHYERIHLTMLLKRYVHWRCSTGAARFEICWNVKSTDATAGAARFEICWNVKSTDATAGAARFEICWNVKSIDATARAAKYEDKSLYFPFKLILLSIFYSLSSYHPTNVILQLDSFSHVAEMLSSLML